MPASIWTRVAHSLICAGVLATGYLVLVEPGVLTPSAAKPESHNNATGPQARAAVITTAATAPQAIAQVERALQPAPQTHAPIDAQTVKPEQPANGSEGLRTQFQAEQVDPDWAGATEASIIMTLTEFAPEGLFATCKATVCRVDSSYPNEDALAPLLSTGLNHLDGFVGGFVDALPVDDRIEVTVYLLRS